MFTTLIINSNITNNKEMNKHKHAPCSHTFKSIIDKSMCNRPVQILLSSTCWPCLQHSEDETIQAKSDKVQNEYHFECVLPWPNHLHKHSQDLLTSLLFEVITWLFSYRPVYQGRASIISPRR